MSSISDRLRAVRAELDQLCEAAGRDPQSVELLAVSKTRPASAVEEAYAAGQRDFGENRVQELLTKAADLELEGIGWHLIGSLQTNKAKDVVGVPGLRLLHSLDRAKLAHVLQARCAELGSRLPVLIQVNASREANKHGVVPEDLGLLARIVTTDCPSLELRGVMAMGPLEGDPEPVFREVAQLHEDLRQESGLELPVRSLGMSGDLPTAIGAGSTLVRVGTAIFGPRGTAW